MVELTARRSPEWLANYQAKRGLKSLIVSEGPKVNKYRNKRTEVDNVIFASKREASRYKDLKLMEQFGSISGLTLQPRYPLIVNDVKIGTYVGDFQFFEGDKKIIEDTKGFRTRVFVMKKNLMKAIYGIEIREV